MSRTRVRHRRLAASIIVATIGASWAVPAVRALGVGEETRPVASTHYVVRPGDTLWSIAERLAPGQDPRPLVDELIGANHLDPGGLQPGRTLLVPAAG